MRVTFFSKRLKFDVDSKNGVKNWEKIFCFWDNYIWIDCCKISLLPREYFSLTVDVLTNSPKHLHITNRDIFRVSSPDNDKKIWQMCCHVDFTSVWDPLTCWLSKSVLKRRFLNNYLSTSFVLNNFENT